MLQHPLTRNSGYATDNGKTFKSACKVIDGVFNKPEVKKHFTKLRVEWAFNLEKARGIFERMIKSAKCCMKKSVGRASLTYDELSTLVTEIEVASSPGHSHVFNVIRR
jgi:hypothetical protein